MRRLIFTLLYDRGQFMLSRNFRLQSVGSIDWLFDNYDFGSVSRGLDELMILDVSRGARNPERFTDVVRHIAGLCFIPITVGGGVTTQDVAKLYMQSGADKLLVNSAFSSNPTLCRSLADYFGRQCIVASLDYTGTGSMMRRIKTNNGESEVAATIADWVEWLQKNGAGEILFQSIDQDGTGMGLDLGVIDSLPTPPEVPCILMGGVGKASHIISGLQQSTVDAVATANLFNFIGSAFLDVRRSVAAAGMDVARWDESGFGLRGRFSS
jgi:cyclase